MNSNKSSYKLLSLVFAISLVGSIGLGVFGPHLFGLSAKPQWMLWAQFALGLISVATVPFAWRWLYRRDAA